MSMSEFFGVSSGFVSIVIATIVITLFCYVLYMICYRLGNKQMKHKLLKLGEYPRNYVITFALVSLFMAILSYKSYLVHNISICALYVSLVFIVVDSVAFLNGFYKEWFDYKE